MIFEKSNLLLYVFQLKLPTTEKGKTRLIFLTFFCIWDLHTLSVLPSKLPSMKGALDAVAHHPSTDGQVGTQMRAVGVQHGRFPLLVPEHHHLFTWTQPAQTVSQMDCRKQNDITCSLLTKCKLVSCVFFSLNFYIFILIH